MVVGPGIVGSGIASADILGIGHHLHNILHPHHSGRKKSNHHHGGPTSHVGGQHNGGFSTGTHRGGNGPRRQSHVARPKPTVSAGTNGSASRPAAEPNSPQPQSITPAQAPTPTDTDISRALSPAASAGGGDGGNSTGQIPISSGLGRAPNLAPVPTAPSSRTIVIRATPKVSAPQAPAPVVSAPAPVVSAPAPVVSAPAAPPVPVVVPPVVVAPAAPAPAAPAPAAPAPAAPLVPVANPPAAEPLSPHTIPATFRIGYADYLRVASTSDLLFAVLPGLAGIILLTSAGGVVGFRQARAAQTLPSPQIARFMP